MQKIVKKVTAVGATLASMLAAVAANAQGPGGVGPIVYQPSGISGFPQLIQQVMVILGWFGTVIMIVAVAMILFAGFKFMTAGENEEAVTGARKMLTWGIIGIVVALLAYSIPPVVKTLTL